MADDDTATTLFRELQQRLGDAVASGRLRHRGDEDSGMAELFVLAPHDLWPEIDRSDELRFADLEMCLSAPNPL